MQLLAAAREIGALGQVWRTSSLVFSLEPLDQERCGSRKHTAAPVSSLSSLCIAACTPLKPRSLFYGDPVVVSIRLRVMRGGSAPRSNSFQVWPVFHRRISLDAVLQESVCSDENTPSVSSTRLPFGLIWIPAPNSRNCSDCSNTSTWKPRCSKAMAAARPPMPPPTISTFLRPRQSRASR